MPVVCVESVELTGATAKAVSLNDLSMGRDENGRWACTATIDV